jgi:hypothetical protein
MRLHEWSGNQFEQRFDSQQSETQAQDLDDLALFPSESAGPELRLPQNEPRPAAGSLIFDRHRVERVHRLNSARVANVSDDKVPSYLLNGLAGTVAIFCSVYMIGTVLPFLPTIGLEERLPIPGGTVLQLPPAASTLRPPAVEAPDLAPTNSGTSVSTTSSTSTDAPRKELSPDALARIRQAATERAAIEAEALTRSFNGLPGSSAGLGPEGSAQPSGKTAP